MALFILIFLFFMTLRCRYVSDNYISAEGAYIGLAPPGDVGSWQRECKVILLMNIE